MNCKIKHNSRPKINVFIAFCDNIVFYQVYHFYMDDTLLTTEYIRFIKVIFDFLIFWSFDIINITIIFNS